METCVDVTSVRCPSTIIRNEIWQSGLFPSSLAFAGIFRFSYRAKHSSKRTVESQLQATLFGLSRDNSRQVPIPTVSLLFLYPVTSAYSLFQQPWQTERITFTRQNSPNKPKDTMVRKCHLNVKSEKR